MLNIIFSLPMMISVDELCEYLLMMLGFCLGLSAKLVSEKVTDELLDLGVSVSLSVIFCCPG